MKLFTKRDKRTNLEKEIDAVLKHIETMDPASEDYTKIVKNLETLYAAKGEKPIRRLSPDTIAIIIGGLLEIGLIMGYEKFSVISTKAWGRLIRGRV